MDCYSNVLAGEIIIGIRLVSPRIFRVKIVAPGPTPAILQLISRTPPEPRQAVPAAAPPIAPPAPVRFHVHPKAG
jgi:hypothetical protein